MGRTGHRPKRSLGQNFLVDANLQHKIVDAVDASSDDEVLEIGPGKGALTRHLVGRVRRLVLVELDDVLVERLRERYGQRPDVEIVHEDVLEVALEDHLEAVESARVVGNIPYNITTPIVFHLLERPRPEVIVLMVQEEVADRIVAPVGTKAYGALSVGIRAVARAERLFKVGRGAFRPVPRVDSAVIRITPRRPERAGPDEEVALRTVVRAAFQWRRKQLRKILRDHPDLRCPSELLEEALAAADASPVDRPETVSPEGFLGLARVLSRPDRIAGGPSRA